MTAARGSKEAAMTLDMENRDPNELNHRVQTLFEDVIGEPEGAHSASGVYRTSYRAYYAGKNCCFTVLTYLCSVPMGFCWGCSYALMSFCQIWQMTPCVQLFNQCFSCWATLYSTITHCLQDPCYEAAALCFTKIYLHYIKSDKGYETKKAATLNEMNGEELPRI